jgi:DNA polymerase-3 subunit epsilon
LAEKDIEPVQEVGVSFVAFDFETANSSRASACSLGMTKVLDGKIVDSMYEIFRPPEGFDNFEGRNIAIHGIRPEDVKGKKRFVEIWPEFHAFINGLPVVAHNASFDISVLRASLSASDFLWPELEYACTRVISKNLFNMAWHKLPDVAHAANVNWNEAEHHNALFDSRICAEIVLSLAGKSGLESLHDFLQSLNLEMGHLFEDGWYTCRSKNISQKSHHSPGEKSPSLREISINNEADPSHPLFGQVVVFTGAISIPRPEAWKLVAEVGAIPKDGLTKKTNYLVLGEQDLSKLKAGETKSGKQREAEALKASGSDIEIIDERDFFALLEPQEWRVDKLIQSKYE